MTAIQNNPKLLNCTRRSMWNSAMKAAQDGLLPDGREGAIVEYGEEAQWMPMIAGLRKKARNSGEIATWDAQVVHKKDAFEFELGDDPFVKHKPCLEADPGRVIAAYSVAVLKSGEKSREVMSVAAIEKVRARSRAKKGGPWFTDYEEMCRKTVARRHSKVLPCSTDLDDLLRRDDALYDMEGASDASIPDKRKTLAGRLDALAQTPPHDPETGEIKPAPAAPKTAAEYAAHAQAWIANLIDPQSDRWVSELDLRNRLNLPADIRERLKAMFEEKIEHLMRSRDPAADLQPPAAGQTKGAPSVGDAPAVDSAEAGGGNAATRSPPSR
jgi:recombination protein RecT